MDLSRRADDAARDLVVELARRARRAARALDAELEAEALHRLRVALRRLRSVLRAYRDVLGEAVPRQRRRALRRIARATSAARDAEVQRAWLRREARALGPDARAAAVFVARELLGRSGTDEALDAAGELPRTVRRLRRDLRRRRRRRRGTRVSFAAASAELLRAHAAELDLSIRRFRRVRDAASAHALRIEVKRVRYVLEPLAGVRGAGAGAAAATLGRLQGALGDLHDEQVLETPLAAAGQAAARALPRAAGIRVRRGLDALEASRRRRVGERLSSISAALAPSSAGSLLASLERIARRLERYAARDGAAARGAR